MSDRTNGRPWSARLSLSRAHTLIRPLKLRAPFETSVLPAVSPLKKLLQPFHFITTGLLLHTPRPRPVRDFFLSVFPISLTLNRVSPFSHSSLALSQLPRAFSLSVFHMIFRSPSFPRPPLRTVEAGSDFLPLSLPVPAE